MLKLTTEFIWRENLPTAITAVINSMRQKESVLQKVTAKTGGATMATRENFVGKIGGHGDVLALISPILKEAQQGSRPVDVLLAEANNIFRQCDEKVFAEVLWRIMLIAFMDTKNENLNRLIVFFYKMLTNIGTVSANGDVLEHGNSLYIRILRLCAKYHMDWRSAVRLRICETVTLILKSVTYNLDDHAGLPLQERLTTMLLLRLDDKIHHVRAESAKALVLLQNFDRVNSYSARITNELMYHLKWDPSAEVRVVITKLACFVPENYQYLVEKVNDVSDEVRKAAIETIAKTICIDSLTIEHRERILQSGLSDTSVPVTKMAEFLLNTWIKFCCGDVILLLTKLDVSFNKRTAELVLKNLLRLPTPELFDTLDRTMITGKVIPLSCITEEKAFYWRFIVETFSHIPSVAEALLPSIPEMCSYLREFSKKFGDEECRQVAGNILSQILKIFLKIPMEEGGRASFVEVLLDLFTYANLDGITIKLILRLFYQNHSGDFEQVLIQKLEQLLNPKKETATAPVADDKPLKLEIGTLIHQRHKMERERDSAVTATDYIQAQKLQDEINQIMERTETLRAQMRKTVECADEYDLTEDEGKKHHSPKALTLAFSALIVHVRYTKTISSHIRAFYEAYVTKSMYYEEVYIRKQVLTLMALFGLVSKTDSFEAAIVCAQALVRDDVNIKTRAIHCLVDLIQHYGFDVFSSCTSLNDIVVKANIRSKGSGCEDDLIEPPLRTLLMHYLGYENIDVVKASVTGIIKLLLANRLSAPRIVSTLLVLWCNPVNDSSSMYHEICTWLPMYVRMGLDQAITVGDAMLPCLERIRSAPKRGYLSHASEEKLIAYIIKNTDQKFLTGFVSTPEVVHERVALSLLKEMKSLGYGVVYIGYGKALKSLNLQSCRMEVVNRLKKKTEYLIKKSNTKRSYLNAFLKYLHAICHNEELVDADSLSEYEGGDVFSDSSDNSQEILAATPNHN